jgi:predicted aspartyl protease
MKLNGALLRNNGHPNRIVGDAASMGCFHADIEVGNYNDLVLAEQNVVTPSKIRRMALSGVVDTGSTRLILPTGVAKSLGLTAKRRIAARYADGRVARRSEVEGVYVTLCGRSGVYNAVLEPDLASPLVGAILLEDLDLLVDCAAQRVFPRDPKYPIYDV